MLPGGWPEESNPSKMSGGSSVAGGRPKCKVWQLLLALGTTSARSGSSSVAGGWPNCRVWQPALSSSSESDKPTWLQQNCDCDDIRPTRTPQLEQKWLRIAQRWAEQSN
jgi:hypothetical protein